MQRACDTSLSDMLSLVSNVSKFLASSHGWDIIIRIPKSKVMAFLKVTKHKHFKGRVWTSWGTSTIPHKIKPFNSTHQVFMQHRFLICCVCGLTLASGIWLCPLESGALFVNRALAGHCHITYSWWLDPMALLRQSLVSLKIVCLRHLQTHLSLASVHSQSFIWNSPDLFCYFYWRTVFHSTSSSFLPVCF